MKTTELALKIIVNDNLSQALQNYLQNIINSLKEEEEKEYYKIRQSNIHSGIFNEEERKEIENYIAYKAGFNTIHGIYYANWKHK